MRRLPVDEEGFAALHEDVAGVDIPMHQGREGVVAAEVGHLLRRLCGGGLDRPAIRPEAAHEGAIGERPLPGRSPESLLQVGDEIGTIGAWEPGQAFCVREVRCMNSGESPCLPPQEIRCDRLQAGRAARIAHIA